MIRRANLLSLNSSYWWVVGIDAIFMLGLLVPRFWCGESVGKLPYRTVAVSDDSDEPGIYGFSVSIRQDLRQKSKPFQHIQHLVI
ncbi:hypothetical protein METHB2_220042 [Candidatus Methylobacter favarea]|uniref:Uncharacterized protein n=1 Tax=Candidatus Methylobacter favarea TaxID=2707345 RepID=A0A8S0X7X6_9GAMM|nr:hypothetical protein [Candidatus Methylobacter favarea]CAA9890470.1 hypothetical protein METHB2_220042 [Candidatus Methylobacter favarea]